MKHWPGPHRSLHLPPVVNTQPTLVTARLRLRPFIETDAEPLCEVAGDRAIADTMISIPHPYEMAQARAWIGSHAGALAAGTGVHWAVVFRQEPTLIGAIELRHLDTEHGDGELSFWIGVQWWGRGYALEAVGAVVGHGFTVLGLNRVHAHHLVRNPASGRVLEKAGFRQEGLLRQRVRKWGIYEDVRLLALLREEWRAAADSARDE